MSTVFAGLAVALSAVGLYGVISYVVAQRTREIGIRIALGGTRRHITRLVVAHALALSVAGLVIGLTGARWGTRLVSSMLYGVTAADWLSYGADLMLLLAISVLAALVPLRRALAVDPLVAMRAD